MGVVYGASDPGLGRRVAVKTLSLTAMGASDNEAELRLRFLREAKAAGRLQHPNIITVHELFQEQDAFYLVMELLEGASLSSVLSGSTPLSLGQKLSIIDQIACGLAEAHAHQIVHRDLKPSNVFVVDSGVVKVLDFGVAKLDEGGLTKAGTVFGTVEYMAPEQVQGRAVGPQADIFSLGVVAYELLAGHNPFRAESLAASVLKIISDTPPPLNEDLHVPAFVESLVFRALKKPLEERFSSLDELRRELARVAEQSGIPLTLPMLRNAAHTTDDSAGGMTLPIEPERPSAARMPESLESIYEEGVEAFNVDAFETSAEHMGRVLDARPTHDAALRYLAESEAKLRQLKLNESDRKRVDELLSGVREAHRRGDAAVVMATVHDVLELDRDSVEARWYRRGAESRLSSPSPRAVPATTRDPSRKPIVVEMVKPAVADRSRRAAWLGASAAALAAIVIGIWMVGSTTEPPIASAQPIALPGVRESPFDTIDPDGTIVLRLPTTATDPEVSTLELRYIVPTVIPAGGTATVGLFGEGFAESATVDMRREDGSILAVKVHDQGHIEVTLAPRTGKESIELLLDNGDGQGTRMAIDVKAP